MTRRRLLLLLGGAIVIVVIGVAVVRSRQEPGYVGTSERATLDWSCGNGIFYRTDRGPTETPDWWAGDDPVWSGHIYEGTVAPTQPHHAEGTITFLSEDTARFTSDLGGTIEMQHTRKVQFFTTGCSLHGP